MSSIDSLDSLASFTKAIQPIRRAWALAAAPVLTATGLSQPVATAVMLVSRLGDGVRQSVLAEEFGVNPTAMVRTLDQAESAGVLERRDVAGNRRVKAVHLSSEGRRQARRIEADLATLRKAIMHDVALDDVETATRVLRLFETRVVAHLQQLKAASR